MKKKKWEKIVKFESIYLSKNEKKWSEKWWKIKLPKTEDKIGKKQRKRERKTDKVWRKTQNNWKIRKYFKINSWKKFKKINKNKLANRNISRKKKTFFFKCYKNILRIKSTHVQNKFQEKLNDSTKKSLKLTDIFLI